MKNEITKLDPRELKYGNFLCQKLADQRSKQDTPNWYRAFLIKNSLRTVFYVSVISSFECDIFHCKQNAFFEVQVIIELGEDRKKDEFTQ